MVDIDAAIGFVVARGDAVERARLSHLRTGASPAEEIFANVEAGQLTTGGWPARAGGDVASVDATCFRLAELDDLSGLQRPSGRRAVRWLAGRQDLDGFWEEVPLLGASAPAWAKPGDPEARFYLTVNAAFWLAVAATPEDDPLPLERAGQAILGSIDENGTWPGFLISGWLAGAVLHCTESFYEAARIFVVLRDRVPTMSAADTAAMLATLRRVGVSTEDPLLVAARGRLEQLQRLDGAWPSDDPPTFDVHTTLTALTALRPIR